MSHRGQSGVALLAVLALMALTLPVAMHLHLQARTDAWIVRNARHHAQSLYTAEAGVSRALAMLASGSIATPIEAGPDGITGSADDGVFPFAAGHRTAFPDARYAYTVTVRRLATDRLELTSRATGPHGSARTVRAVVEVAPAIGAPRLLAWREIH